MNRGISIYLAVVLISVVLALALAVSSISLSQAKMARSIGYSVAAFFAAETGVERTLYEISLGAPIGSQFSGSLDNGASYSADILAPGADCSAATYCLKSVGNYNNTRRAIFLTR